jgi:hypothetical protein
VPPASGRPPLPALPAPPLLPPLPPALVPLLEVGAPDSLEPAEPSGGDGGALALPQLSGTAASAQRKDQERECFKTDLPAMTRHAGPGAAYASSGRAE